MISQLTGTVVSVGATWLVLDLNGFGLKALCSPTAAAGARVGATVTLATSLVVREDSLTLYAFADADERDCFELVQTASGIGPKIAQAVVSVLSPEELRTAIATDNLVALTKVPGIGRKGAQRLVIELKDKLHATASEAAQAVPGLPGGEGWRAQVKTGLEGLGWSSRDAEAACDRVQTLTEEDPTLGVAELMRAALRSLAR